MFAGNNSSVMRFVRFQDFNSCRDKIGHVKSTGEFSTRWKSRILQRWPGGGGGGKGGMSPDKKKT